MPVEPAPDTAPDPAPGPAQGPALDAPVERARRVRRLWRVGTPVVALLSGVMFVVSAKSSEGVDLRPGRYTDLSTIVSGESRDVQQLQAQARALDRQVQALAAGVKDRQVDRISARVDKLEEPAGRTPVTGAGLTITLSDAPTDVLESSSRPINSMLVHQQNIENVVNAMWLAGATAVTIQGQRVITTTGIKCSGNNVRLHGLPYAQPYVISAVGDQSALYDAVMADPDLQFYRELSAIPDIAVGWDLQLESDLLAPAYDGSLDLSYARPLT